MAETVVMSYVWPVRFWIGTMRWKGEGMGGPGEHCVGFRWDFKGCFLGQGNTTFL